MSNTKALIKYVSDRLNDGPNITFGKPTVLDLVEALESAEARVHELEGSLSRSISKQSEMADGIERVVKANHALAAKAQEAEARAESAEAERKKDLAHCKYEFERAEQAEANVARLTKERDWLAMHLSGYDAQKKCTVYAADWKEAARRAVAAGEE